MSAILSNGASVVEQENKRNRAKKEKAIAADEIANNPLFLLEQGKPVVSDLPAHKQGARTGNLYFEYAQNVAQLRGVVRSGRDIAVWLESKDLIVFDRLADRYMWKAEPLTKSQFLAMVLPRIKRA